MAQDNKERKDIEEMRLLLVDNMFEELSEDSVDRLESFYTPFQVKLRLKVPLENAEYNMALQCLGLRAYYEGHTIPMNPDNTAFIIKESDDGEKYIQTLINKSMLDEIESFIEEDENFNNHMVQLCKKDFDAFMSSEDLVSFSVLTSGPSELFSHILTYGSSQSKKSIKTERTYHIYVNNNLTEAETLSYVTPYKEGVKSSYEYTGIAVPSMPECLNASFFTSSLDSLRTYYKICSGKNVISDDTIKVKNFMAKLIEKNRLPEEYGIESISNNYISLRRVSKYLFGEYHSLFDLSRLLNHGTFLINSSVGESELLISISKVLKEKIPEIIKKKNEEDKYN